MSSAIVFAGHRDWVCTAPSLLGMSMGLEPTPSALLRSEQAAGVALPQLTGVGAQASWARGEAKQRRWKQKSHREGEV